MRTSIPKKIWDLPTRITHWGLASCVVLNLFVLEEGDNWHRWLGYTSVAFVLFRFVWGLLGAPASHFKSFPISFQKIYAFWLTGFNNNNFVGHNPIASIIYILIWINLISLGVSGYMMGLDAYWGDEKLETLHANLAILLQIFIGIHLLGVFIDSLRYRRNTWAAMITGKKY